MIGTVFTPGTIFLMIVGAMNTSFRLDNQLCLLLSGAPILIFIFICFYTKNDIQIKFSLILSIGYALLMLAVIVSTVIEVIQEGVWHPSALFFFSLCASFLIAALIHPTEFDCFLPFGLYLLCIPSMYLLLTIYSIINLNVISWGTREGISQQQRDQTQNERQEKGRFLKNLSLNKWFKNQSKLISCVCCSHSEPNEERKVMKEIAEIKDQLKEVKSLIKTSELIRINHNLSPNPSESVAPFQRFSYSTQLSNINESETEVSDQNQRPRAHTESLAEDVSDIYDNIGNEKPFWIKDKCFDSFIEQDLDLEESEFWRQLIDIYLRPLDSDPQHEEKVQFELKELRDKIASAFGFLNSLFILLVLLLQMHKDIFDFRFTIKEGIVAITSIVSSIS